MGQILTYAAGTGAKKVIGVAESFQPEHVAALEFLNQNTMGLPSSGSSSCAELVPYRHLASGQPD